MYFSLFGKVIGDPMEGLLSSDPPSEPHHSQHEFVLKELPSNPVVVAGASPISSLPISRLHPMSLRHLNFLLKLLHSHPRDSALILSVLRWSLDTSSSLPPPKIDPEEAASSLAVSVSCVHGLIRSHWLSAPEKHVLYANGCMS